MQNHLSVIEPCRTAGYKGLFTDELCFNSLPCSSICILVLLATERNLVVPNMRKLTGQNAFYQALCHIFPSRKRILEQKYKGLWSLPYQPTGRRAGRRKNISYLKVMLAEKSRTIPPPPMLSCSKLKCSFYQLYMFFHFGACSFSAHAPLVPCYH